jgi:hypothetical protein
MIHMAQMSQRSLYDLLPVSLNCFHRLPQTPMKHRKDAYAKKDIA